MATDYDAPRVSESGEAGEESLEELAVSQRRNGATTAVLDLDDGEVVDSFELPDADLSGEELTVRVLPKQSDEFACSSCFLVQHRNRLAMHKDGRPICADCI
jgi:hypothetical protein